MNKIDESSCCNHYFNDNSSIIPKTNRTTPYPRNNINDMFYSSNTTKGQSQYIQIDTIEEREPHTTKEEQYMTYMSHNNIKTNFNRNDTKAEEEVSSSQSQTLSHETISKLRLSNEMLLKDNDNLNNMCDLLKKELLSIKKNEHQSPYSQYDSDLNDFISNLQQALNCSQAENRKLEIIIKETKRQVSDLYKENKQIVQLYNELKIDYQSKIKELSELKIIVNSKDTQLEKHIKQIEHLNNNIKSMENQSTNNDLNMKYQSTISSSKIKYQNDIEETLSHLKQTIDTYQKSNMKLSEKNTLLQNQNDIYKHNLSTKEAAIDKMQSVIHSKEKEESKIREEIEQLKTMIKQQKVSIMNKQNELRIEYGENEKQKTQVESLKLFIQDRERTIITLKESLSILTKTFDNDLNAIQAQSNDQVDIQKYINDKTNEFSGQIKQLEKEKESLAIENNDLRKECSVKQKEIDDLLSQCDQFKYEYQLLYQKYKEQNILVDRLRGEYLNKKNDSELIDVIKANEEILKKLQRIEEENATKTKELKRLKNSNSKLSNELIETQRLLNGSLENTIDNPYSNSHRNGLLTMSDNNINSHTAFSQCEINDLEESTSTQRLDSLLNNTTTIGNYLFFTIVECSYVLSFNLQLKQFCKIQYTDNSKIFKNEYDHSIAIKINISNGLLVINNDKVFLFDSTINTIDLIAQLSNSHRKANCLCVNKELYIISGQKTKRCEKVLLKSSVIIQLPSVNYTRTEGGLCYVDNRYLYALFGNCEPGYGSIERLDVECQNHKWEVMPYNSANTFVEKSSISHFICLADEQRIMIMGGINQNGICNHSLIQYDYHNGELSSSGESRCFSLFNEQSTQIEDNLYINFDIEGNPHIFDTMFSFYKVYKNNSQND